MSKSTRRDFLKRLAFSSRADSCQRTLVCVFLRGGADTLNMVVPYLDDDYYRARPTLAIASPEKRGVDSAIRLTDFYALHPKMRPLKKSFADGRLLFVQSVGCDNTSGSHFEAQDQIDHGERAGERLNGGWLGRHLRSISRKNSSPFIAVAMGSSIPESLRGAPSASAISSISDLELRTEGKDTEVVASALASMYGARCDVLGQAGQNTIKLLNKVDRLQRSASAPAGGADYPASSFGKALLEVSRLVRSNVGLEVACIDHGGWDTHFFQGGASGFQASNIDDLALGLSAFDQDMKAQKAAVTTIVITEFGRRSYENSSMGTDHGRGFACMLLGDSVAGGRVLGDWPGIKEEPSLSTSLLGPSGLKVQIDYRSVLAEVLSSALGNKRLYEVFPGFTPTRLELFR